MSTGAPLRQPRASSRHSHLEHAQAHLGEERVLCYAWSWSVDDVAPVHVIVYHDPTATKAQPRSINSPLSLNSPSHASLHALISPPSTTLLSAHSYASA